MKKHGRSGLLRNWSISRRLSLWYSLSILILLGAFALVTYAEFHNSIHADFDQHLRHETSLLLPLIATDGEAPRFITQDALSSTAYETTGIYATYVRLLDVGGDVLAESPNFCNIPLSVPGPPLAPVESTSSTEWAGSPLRTLYTPILERSGVPGAWLEVSGVEWAVHQQLAWLIRTYLAGILISTLLAFGGGYLLARRALQPVEQITSAAKNIKATDLGARLPTRFGVNDELTRLAETINELLARLEDSIKREQRFISNATHELMTPLTTLRGELDLTRRSSEDRAMLDALGVALDDIDRMEHIIRSLLTLSRAEKLTVDARITFDAAELAGDHVERFTDRADVRDIRLTVAGEPGLRVAADPVNVGTVLDNLLDNALKYTPNGGKINVAVEQTGSRVRIAVSDTGYGFDEQTAERIFDRFFRSDESDIQKESGSGLGLAIARAITRAYGGSISGTSPGPGLGSTMSVEFPLVSERHPV